MVEFELGGAHHRSWFEDGRYGRSKTEFTEREDKPAPRAVALCPLWCGMKSFPARDNARVRIFGNDGGLQSEASEALTEPPLEWVD